MIPFPMIISSVSGSSILPEGNIKQLAFSYTGTDRSMFSSAMILTKDGRLYGQGLNDHGDLGLGHKNAIYDTFRLTNTNVKRVFGGGGMFMIEKNDGTWLYVGNVGSSFLGQVGHQAPSVTTWSPLPSALLNQFDFSTVVDIASSAGATLYLLQNGEVWGAGGNTSFQLGISPGSYVNAQRLSTTGVRIFSSRDSTAILETNGKLRWAGLGVNWGNNTELQRTYLTLTSPSGFITNIGGGSLQSSGSGNGILAEWKDTQASTLRKLSYRYASVTPSFPTPVPVGQDFSFIPEGNYGTNLFDGDKFISTDAAGSLKEVPDIPEFGPWEKGLVTHLSNGTSVVSSSVKNGYIGLYNGNLFYRGDIRFMNAPFATGFRPLTVVTQD